MCHIFIVWYCMFMAWPTTDNPRTRFVTIRLTEDEAADLDALAQATGRTRSEVVRAAADLYVAAAQTPSAQTPSAQTPSAQTPAAQTPPAAGEDTPSQAGEDTDG